MASDRFIYFKGDGEPPRSAVESALRNFFGEAAILSLSDGRFYATLPGSLSCPFKDFPDTPKNRFDNDDRGRWIEICISVGNIDVITRGMDEYTNVLADGLAKMIARYWQGELEEE